MLKTFFISLAVMLTATPSLAQSREQLIIVDNTNICGNARLVYHKRAEAEKIANRLAYKIGREQNIKTRVVILNPGEQVGTINRTSSSPIPVYLNNGC